MKIKIFKVPNISCGHCVATIERELRRIEGVRTVKADVESRLVTVEWEEPPASWPGLRAVLDEIEYSPED